MNRFYVYAILLDRPGLPPGRAVYVGSSAYPPEERLRRHQLHTMSTSRHVRRYGVRLMPELYAHLNQRFIQTRDEAKHVERGLRASLERRGFRVFGACYPREARCLIG